MLSGGVMFAQGTGPKPKPADYPAHAEAGTISAGAEYMVHSFSGRGQTFVAKDYLVVEVALYGAKDARIEVQQSHFTLHVSGSKKTLLAQSPSFVAASLKYPDWEAHPTLEAGAGVGNAGVILGRPQQVERFPGDRRPPQTRTPRPPEAPEQDHGVNTEPPPKAEEVVIQTALPEGNLKLPVSGYLYFVYKGNVTGIKSLELVYAGPAEQARLKLR
jgi:hypothetical protein